MTIFKYSNIFASEKEKRTIKIIQTYLSGFKIEVLSLVSALLWLGAYGLSLYTPSHEAFWDIKAVLIYSFLGMFLVKILLLRELSILFDIVTLIILIRLSAQII